MTDVARLPASQIIGLCDECIGDIGVSLEQISGRVLECMACDRRESEELPIRRCRVTPADFGRLCDQA